MQSKLNPYIGFRGNAKQAMEFYEMIFGGKLILNTYKESGSQDPTEADKIMHAMLIANNGITIMASDVPDSMAQNENGNISISLNGDDEAELSGYWHKLSPEAKITQPLEKAPWGDTFGMLTDQFGINWMVNITGKKE
jgi:PhnB protein